MDEARWNFEGGSFPEWICYVDLFQFWVSCGKRVTQRILILLDLGVQSPYCQKLLLQQLWKCKQGWDTPLDNETIRKFKIWAADSQELVKIPRWIRAGEGEADSLSLHCFSDASKNALDASYVSSRSRRRDLPRLISLKVPHFVVRLGTDKSY
ncbi:hypothetical protein NQ317_009294 [Molorchus minor]|uniref:Uncharacterized protein n=1 Tax=Molorchus minor TaxID=1323400 RepID=A0ABQ9IRF9_9CUCU|nr:hypothetical protein NQ317_009294 [Molorchus minor]